MLHNYNDGDGNNGEGMSTIRWFTLTTPMDHARRIIATTEALRQHHAVRGGGHASLQAQRKAAANFQATMQPSWRGLESLLLDGGTSTHVLRVIMAQRRDGDTTQDMSVAVVTAARGQSRAAAQLALERARFDARQVH